ncbi:uncharacterized protein LACBIDRAFT_299387 [Laccaria bicolor S238N-H82]|uniref:Predicted protein n=1 Tax=Laccaria bicolor (strain S238N-H82 / ATCC MYA-4686) TaxID=486041 RepID=B0DEL9_LACBS|nr:uncharacterized protein LACBIDRAFT_299387 [Laccaria bicolor S238N-H82]EDR07054.1 predicted protein [Laccaria bicolor S238N-H82]|eukprot:XP_001882427.1 predicted protein [Laccaria bicolor S238N-H82]
MLNDIGRFRELPSWRKDFKADWKKAMKKSVQEVLMKEKYCPDTERFVCTCPQFVISRFLICKHLVQSFQPVNPVFFLQVMRNRTTPFWSHPALIPLQTESLDNDHAEMAEGVGPTEPIMDDDLDPAEDRFDDDAVDTREGIWESEQKTFKEEMDAHIQKIRDFADGLEYQISFQDRRFLKTLQKEGAGFFRLAENCLSREHRFNSSREASPTTWESSTANAMFYRTRPRRDRMQTN